MSTFQKLNRSLLKVINKIIRYRHHVVIISTYTKFKKIPKGFRLKFHSNLPGLEMQSILKKCSNKMMEKTLLYYNKTITSLSTKTNFKIAPLI